MRWSFRPFIGHVWAVWGHSIGVPSHRKWESKPSEMTVERAVSLLSIADEDALLHAAGHIQTRCFRSTDAKKKVCSGSF